MPSNHLILCHPLLLLPSIFPSIRVYSNQSVLHIRRPKYQNFCFNISPSNEYSGLISFRMNWLTSAMKLKDICSLEEKLMTSLDSVLKSRDITLPTKACLVKAMVFPVVMYGCESWTIKKAECQGIDALALWCWRRLLRVPWTARRSNQSILKEISPGRSLEGLMLKLKLQYFGHLM